ncbi:MAG TPA: 50S ribosomal protein L9 [Bacillota bacterium]|jgi:large subunit ribosomal protein L9|nr:50S ribosomal protein L9 [Fastidiosipila sp.]HPX93718.1 50S ribosomal protein L9 [Bacillota bacterium]HQB81466.1 50S ribosomal protein L9 [Bacillota bacterium]
MKVLLLEGIKGLGQAGDVVEVKPGYARNYLFKRNLATQVTKDKMNLVEMQRAAREKSEGEELDRARKMAESLDGQHFTYTAKAGAAGRLYGTVTNQNIADLLSEAGYPVDKREVTVSEPVKTVGSHQVTIRLHPEVSVTFKLDVKAEL